MKIKWKEYKIPKICDQYNKKQIFIDRMGYSSFFKN